MAPGYPPIDSNAPTGLGTDETRRDSASIIMVAAKSVNRPQQREETRSPSITTFFFKGCAEAAKTAIFASGSMSAKSGLQGAKMMLIMPPSAY